MAREGTGIAGAIDYVPAQRRARPQARCFVCGSTEKVDGASRVLPPLALCCSRMECLTSETWLKPYSDGRGGRRVTPLLADEGEG